MQNLTARDLVIALDTISRKNTVQVVNGLTMLKAHYRAPNRLISARGLAAAIEKKAYGVGNVGYGKFCHEVADIMGFEPDVEVDGDIRWTYTLCNAHPTKDRYGEFLWVLKPEVCLAIEELGWVRPVIDTTPEEDIDACTEMIQSAPEKSRAAVVRARTGQGVYRERVLAFWGYRCAVTGLAIPELLVASHIKPWRDCSWVEAIDMPNGLALSPNIDRAFDKGYISFGDDARILISPELSDDAKEVLGIYAEMRLVKDLLNQHLAYLTHHRDKIFKW
ncbi:HNH endonuclease [Pseudomonas oryzihabitans]|uniref:HNH nuclease domain-containing protein n=1 Tax=Pseudomonas oryzihabitans TaxID=47885 RepID=A0ABX3IY13_9PSED|nr:HNH endonuclease [Pseudomonas psychrotolerans]ONN72452.1 hypothetical protein BVL52_01345 [Pseudomonas psychrotolerans]